MINGLAIGGGNLAMIYFLASPPAQYILGTNFRADGGLCRYQFSSITKN